MCYAAEGAEREKEWGKRMAEGTERGGLCGKFWEIFLFFENPQGRTLIQCVCALR